MKYIIPILLLIILVVILVGNNTSFIHKSGSITKSDTIKMLKCRNKFDFISSTDTIPVLNFDIETPYYLTRNDISNLYYNEDLCTLCAPVEFKIPFDIENEQGFLKITTDFDTPYCQKCPIPIRFRKYYRIDIDNKNQLFIENKISSIDSFQSNIEKNLHRLTNLHSDTNPVNYLIDWDKGANQTLLDTTLTKIYKAHWNILEKKVRETNRDLCDLNKQEIIHFKKKYPIRIEFDLGKSEKMHENIYRNYK